MNKQQQRTGSKLEKIPVFVCLIWGSGIPTVMFVHMTPLAQNNANIVLTQQNENFDHNMFLHYKVEDFMKGPLR